jgi:hypothetical protein
MEMKTAFECEGKTASTMTVSEIQHDAIVKALNRRALMLKRRYVLKKYKLKIELVFLKLRLAVLKKFGQLQ